MADTISTESFLRKLELLKEEMDAGRLKHGEYDQQLARMIGELRERKVDADRAKMNATLEEALSKGYITPAVKTHLEMRLGLA